MNKKLLSYAAGYIDGDGCFYVGKYRSKNIDVYEQSIQIVSVKKPVLEEFQINFGGSIREKPFKPNHKTAYCWTIKGYDSIVLCNQILPYMVEKIYQNNLFISFYNLIEFNNFRTVNPQIINQRNDIIFNIRMDKHMNNLISREDIENLKDQQFTITPSETDYPYLAGLIDSEGCFRIRKWKPKNRPNEAYAISIEIGNTKLPIMPWLVKRFGGSVSFIEAKANRRASATWILSAAKLYEILPKIQPFLRSKREICDKLIEFQQTILPNGGDRHSELFRALFEKRQEIRERIVAEIHEFNRKGSH